MNAISVQALRKEFTLGSPRRSYGTFKELLGLQRAAQPVASRQFLALDDVSFEVARGETIGIIGRNGAGKSTLLKVLSRILRPTKGRVELRGRVGSLLEVGAGFHPELTGRENIFLNAAILGLNHGEIAKKFDEIVAFAGVERHLDEPVKHYSSGMYMRLAFSVAAHIEPEILLIDEVLAVGDAEFQKKSLQRLEKVSGSGQTILLVSHNIQTVLRLCQRAVHLDQGRVVAIGKASDVASHYLDLGGANRGARQYAGGPYAPGDHVVRLRGVRVRSRDGETLSTIDIGREFGIEIEFEVAAGGVALMPSFSLLNEQSTVLWATDAASSWHGRPRPAGRYSEAAWVPANFLSTGVLRVTAAIHSFRPYCVHFVEPDAVVFHAVETQAGSRGEFGGTIEAGARPLLEWTVTYDE
jgi:lipopolysaccharide transport system ATP-binding protein